MLERRGELVGHARLLLQEIGTAVPKMLYGFGCD
jgi:hypothetical protein